MHLTLVSLIGCKNAASEPCPESRGGVLGSAGNRAIGEDDIRRSSLATGQSYLWFAEPAGDYDDLQVEGAHSFPVFIARS